VVGYLGIVVRFDTKFLIALVPYLTFLFYFSEIQMASVSRLLRERSSFNAVVVVARLIHGSRVASLGPLYSVRLNLSQSGELWDLYNRKRGFIS
jgi:hypothetical protein